MKYILLLFILMQLLYAECKIPKNLEHLVKKISKNNSDIYSDIKRNHNNIENLCLFSVRVKEHKYLWKMLLVLSDKKDTKKSAFWFLPHDDENTAFDSAIYAINRYGGGFLSILANDKRYFKKQDPNRNFGETKETSSTCSKQKYSAPKYSKTIFKIIDAFKSKKYPYLALHNNKDGYFSNGGRGGVSILKSSRVVQSYKAYKHITKNTKGLQDEDSLVYMAGISKKPNHKKLNRLLNLGLNVKYEVVTKRRNDCSLSNYVVLHKKTTAYYNIETEHGDLKTQKKMIDKIMSIFK